jgi:hypothetical protein
LVREQECEDTYLERPAFVVERVDHFCCRVVLAPLHLLYALSCSARFGPCPSSTDYLSLFTDNSPEWQRVRGSLAGFQFYVQQLLNEPCTICGENNTLAGLVSVNAFQVLSELNIGIHVEAGALKEWSCDATGSVGMTLEAIRNVAANGGQVQKIGMDEPLNSALGPCNGSIDTAAQYVANWITTVRSQSGLVDLVVGDVEPYPALSAETLCQWLQAITDGTSPLPGGPIQFLHLDIDFHAIKDMHQAARDVSQIKQCGDKLGITFGAILNNLNAVSGADYVQGTLRHMNFYEGSVTRVGHAIFESWEVATGLPQNLPVTNATTHTGLIAQACGV